jgi:hypothetical protein
MFQAGGTELRSTFLCAHLNLTPVGSGSLYCDVDHGIKRATLGLHSAFFSRLRGKSRGFQADGLDERVEIVGDTLVETIKLGSPLRFTRASTWAALQTRHHWASWTWSNPT